MSHGDDGRTLSKGPTTREMARRFQDEWNYVTPIRV